MAGHKRVHARLPMRYAGPWTQEGLS